MAWQPPDGFATIADFKAVGFIDAQVAESTSIPGDELDVTALGYLHANCSHCHNQARPEKEGARCFDPDEDFDLSFPVDSLLNLEEVPAYATTVRTRAL